MAGRPVRTSTKTRRHARQDRRRGQPMPKNLNPCHKSTSVRMLTDTGQMGRRTRQKPPGCHVDEAGRTPWRTTAEHMPDDQNPTGQMPQKRPVRQEPHDAHNYRRQPHSRPTLRRQQWRNCWRPAPQGGHMPMTGDERLKMQPPTDGGLT